MHEGLGNIRFDVPVKFDIENNFGIYSVVFLVQEDFSVGTQDMYTYYEWP
jgi:hypothetical protein